MATSAAAAPYAVEQVPFVLQQTAEFSAGDYGAALVKTLEATHAMWLREAPPSDLSGSLATLALLANGELYVASLGNGRCIVCSKDGQATGLAGNREKNDIPHRGLFGPEQPSVECAAVALGPSDAFVLLASDGVWDVFSSSKAGEIVARSLQADPKAPHKAAKALCDAAYNAESDDNISAAVLVCEWDSYPPPPPPTEPPRPKPTAVATAKPAAAVAAVAKPKATAVAASAKPVATAVAATAKPLLPPLSPQPPSPLPPPSPQPPSPLPQPSPRPPSPLPLLSPQPPSPLPQRPSQRTVCRGGTGQKFEVDVPYGIEPGMAFVANYYGIEYQLECPPGLSGGESFTAEIEDYRGVRPKRATIPMPQGCYPGDTCIVTIDANNNDGTLEEYEIDIPEDYDGGPLLIDLPDDGTPAKVKPKIG